MGPGLAAPVPGALATGTVLSVGGGDVNGGAGAALRGKVIVFCSETEMLGPPCGAARLRGGGGLLCEASCPCRLLCAFPLKVPLFPLAFHRVVAWRWLRKADFKNICEHA